MAESNFFQIIQPSKLGHNTRGIMQEPIKIQMPSRKRAVLWGPEPRSESVNKIFLGFRSTVEHEGVESPEIYKIDL